MTSMSGRLGTPCLRSRLGGPKTVARGFQLQWPPPTTDMFPEHRGDFCVCSSSSPAPSDKQGSRAQGGEPQGHMDLLVLGRAGGLSQLRCVQYSHMAIRPLFEPPALH